MFKVNFLILLRIVGLGGPATGGSGEGGDRSGDLTPVTVLPEPTVRPRKASLSPKHCLQGYLTGREFGVSLQGRLPTCEAEDLIMTEELMAILHTAIPPRWRLCSQWRLLYSTAQHGFSLATLYQRCREQQASGGPVMLAVRDGEDHVFGVFATEPWHPAHGHYGTGECFVWRVEGHLPSEGLPYNPAEEGEEGAEVEGGTVPPGYYRVRRWGSTGKNDYFLMSEANFLAAGCGDGHFGLWLDAALEEGHSRPVPTFDNLPLAGSDDTFRCLSLEVWGLALE